MVIFSSVPVNKELFLAYDSVSHKVPVSIVIFLYTTCSIGNYILKETTFS